MSRRMIARAGIFALGALTLAACKDSGTAPLNVTPDQLQSMGEAVAAEIEAGAAQLTAQDVMATNGGAPSFARIPRASAPMFSGMSLSRVGSAATVASCGVPSQNPPVDTDGDQVPDDWTLTFALPACEFTDQTNTYDITGALNVKDPVANMVGFDLDFSLQNFKLAFSGANGSGYILANGHGTVGLSSGTLTQSHHWTEVGVVSGVASATATIDWTASFTPAQGQTITAGQSLPDGTYEPNGGVEYNAGNRVASFTVTTLVPLQYSAACAAGVANGTSMTPFTGGKIRVNVSSQQGSGYADVTYSSCNSATVSLVSQ